MSDKDKPMPERIFAEAPRTENVGWAYWYPADQSKFIKQTEYIRADLVDALAEVLSDVTIKSTNLDIAIVRKAIAAIQKGDRDE